MAATIGDVTYDVTCMSSIPWDNNTRALCNCLCNCVYWATWSYLMSSSASSDVQGCKIRTSCEDIVDCHWLCMLWSLLFTNFIQ
jgi:hypothetical protein